MSVLLETSLGDITIDLHIKESPKASFNFIKLCKMKYYNHSLFFDIQRDFITRIKQTFQESTSIYEQVQGKQQKYFADEIHPFLRHDKMGVVSTSNSKPNENTGDFFIQLSEHHLQHLNNKHTVFGQVVEGIEILQMLNDQYTDDRNRPYYNIRILHTLIIYDPFPDQIEQISIQYPLQSPDYTNYKDSRLEFNQNYLNNEKGALSEEQIQELTKQHQIKSKAIVLEMLNDIPDSEIKPPDNVLFICKLNPITIDKDLEVIFSRFGEIKSCEIVKDWKTGQSLGYGFIEFNSVSSCEEAYFKMNNCLIDDHRIQVDFSQSVSKLFNKQRKVVKEVNEQLNDNKGYKNKGINLSQYLDLKQTQRKDNSKYQIVYDDHYQQPIHHKSNQHKKYKDRSRSRSKHKTRKSKVKN